MSGDALFAAAKLKTDLDKDSEKEALPILSRCAEDFLLAGGTLSLQDWALLSSTSRTAFVWAGRKLRAEQANLHAICMDGPHQRASVVSEFDDGAQAGQIFTEVAAFSALDNLKKESKGLR